MIELRISDERLAALRHSPVVYDESAAIFRIEGTGAVVCVQGIFTNDVAKLAVGSIVFGAFLTPKGMIVSPAWLIRHEAAITVVAPAEARTPLLDSFRRQLPPRLAKVIDVTDTDRVLLATSGAILGDAQPGLSLCAAPAKAWFSGLAVGPIDQVADVAAHAIASGAIHGTADEREVARVLGGWPALGAEIDDRTLPQEVRFDELDGVSYNKGCYTGQETVARIHFRGHPNRELRGLRWHGGTSVVGTDIVADEKSVGTIRSLVISPATSWGLAPIRREVPIGTTVIAGGASAEVCALPFDMR